jgi:hypothetical protein
VFTTDRLKQRKFLAQAWEKYNSNHVLEPLELQLAKIIERHPEYQEFIKNLDTEYFPEQGKTNPFLHINLHLALQDQLGLDQPKGIKKIYSQLLKKIKDTHQVEHIMMEQIAEMIFNSQKYNKTMNLEYYLESLNELIKD